MISIEKLIRKNKFTILILFISILILPFRLNISAMLGIRPRVIFIQTGDFIKS